MYITDKPIDCMDFFSFTPNPSCGAVSSFMGIVRNHDHGRAVLKLRYECYRPMANKMIQALIEEAKAKWNPAQIRVLHRVGTLEIGEAAVAIAVEAAHRAEAFSSCSYLIESIKKRVPIWKKEIFQDGSSEWVLCGHSVEAVA